MKNQPIREPSERDSYAQPDEVPQNQRPHVFAFHRTAGECLTQINDAFSSFFKLLGYGVTYEGSSRTGELWHEICDNEGIICQVSFGTPIAEFLADLPYLVDGKPGIGPTDYWCACQDNERLRGLLARVRSAKATASNACVPAEVGICHSPPNNNIVADVRK
jgi:hypothetical protein